MWNMDEKGFILDTANRAKVIARAGRRAPRTTHDVTRELITVIETCGAKQVMLSPMVVFKGTAHYKGWYSEVSDEKPAYFAYSLKGYTTDEIGLDWLQKFDAQTRTEVSRGSTRDGHVLNHWERHFSLNSARSTLINC